MMKMAKRMKETAKKETRGKEEGLLKKGVNAFKARLIDAKKATIILFVMILLSIITGILGYYLYTPAKELYISESTFQSETRKIYDFPKDSCHFIPVHFYQRGCHFNFLHGNLLSSLLIDFFF